MITYGTYAVPRADLGEAFHEFNPAGMTFIADAILPAYGVPKEDGTITVITRENIRIDDDTRADGGTFNRIDMEGEDLAYATQDKGLEIAITDRERRKYAKDFQVDLEKTAILKLRMLLKRELRVKNLVFNTATWTGSTLYTDNSGSPWDNIATDIIGQIVAAKEKVRLNTGVRANALIVGESAVQNMIKNTAIKARFQGTTTITVDMIRAGLASLVGLQQLIVGDTVYNSADEGQTFSGSEIWPDDYATVAVVASGPGMPVTTPCVGRTLRWTEMADGLLVPEMYREPQTKSDILQVEDYVDEKVFDPYFAHLMKIDA
ncbi:hypothetical protein M0R72_14460 [Candidatus Pacearchaeota archaeon]|jgi:hypothetical protein|nr:hypothetical protein [Candidatus Pacearchaeota archaeon]